MAEAITFDNLTYYFNYFLNLKKAGIQYEIQKTERYAGMENGRSYQQLILYPSFKGVKSIRGLADIWTAAPNAIPLNTVEHFTGYDTIHKVENSIAVTSLVYRKFSAGIKFFAGSVFDNNPRVSVYLITGDVPEVNHDDHTIRTCISGNYYGNGRIVACCDETTPYYNYLDKGHAVIHVATGEHLEDGHRTFITDNVSLDMNFIIAAASVYPPAIDDVIQHKAFLPSKDCRMTLIKVERNIPAKLRPEYITLKQRIQDDFNKNISGVMIGNLTRKESPFVDINGIRITSTKADYVAGRVSIEAPNLAEVVFAKLNPNEAEWDIFTLINIYTDWVNNEFKSLPLNTAGTGFLAAKSFNFKINNIPLKVSCFAENTRRAINDHLINVDELSPTLKRASCYPSPVTKEEEDNIANYEKFVANVSRYSLKTRDIWANGLPVKTVFLECDRQGWGKPATVKHPKLRFILKDKKTDLSKGFHLLVNVMDAKEVGKVNKTNEYRIGKFAEFIKKVEALNRTSSMGYAGDYVHTAEGFYVPRNAAIPNPCAVGLSNLLGTYAEGITEEDKKSIVGTINYELSEAEKRSEILLKEACELTKSVTGTRQGKKGYIVPGKMRTYFVEDEGQMKVWEHNETGSGKYFCIVNSGDMGVGKDALVARLFALCNDEMMAKHIHTLKK